MILIESALLIVAVFGIAAAINIWQNSSSNPDGGCQQTLVVGKSVEGISIEACQLNGSNPDAENTLLVIGTIHGDEPDGTRVID